MTDRLNRFVGRDTEFYFRAGQVVTLEGRMFQHQVRFRDSFGAELIGHYMIDERNYEVPMRDATLASFREACNTLLAHQTEPP